MATNPVWKDASARPGTLQHIQAACQLGAGINVQQGTNAVNVFCVELGCILPLHTLHTLQIEQVTGQPVSLAVPGCYLAHQALGCLHVGLDTSIDAVQGLKHVHLLCLCQIAGHQASHARDPAQRAVRHMRRLPEGCHRGMYLFVHCGAVPTYF